MCQCAAASRCLCTGRSRMAPACGAERVETFFGRLPCCLLPEILNLAGMLTHGISYKFRQMAALYHGLGGGRHTPIDRAVGRGGPRSRLNQMAHRHACMKRNERAKGRKKCVRKRTKWGPAAPARARCTAETN